MRSLFLSNPKIHPLIRDEMHRKTFFTIHHTLLFYASVIIIFASFLKGCPAISNFLHIDSNVGFDIAMKIICFGIMPLTLLNVLAFRLTLELEKNNKVQPENGIELSDINTWESVKARSRPSQASQSLPPQNLALHPFIHRAKD